MMWPCFTLSRRFRGKRSLLRNILMDMRLHDRSRSFANWQGGMHVPERRPCQILCVQSSRQIDASLLNSVEEPQSVCHFVIDPIPRSIRDGNRCQIRWLEGVY
jgi:hypothetical protein